MADVVDLNKNRVGGQLDLEAQRRDWEVRKQLFTVLLKRLCKEMGMTGGDEIESSFVKSSLIKGKWSSFLLHWEDHETGTDSYQSITLHVLEWARHIVCPRIKVKPARFSTFHMLATIQTKKALWPYVLSIKMLIWLLNFKNIFVTLFIWIFFLMMLPLRCNDTAFSKEYIFWFIIFITTLRRKCKKCSHIVPHLTEE